MSTKALAYNSVASIFNEWPNDPTKAYARVDFTDGTNHSLGVPLPAATGIPSTASVASLLATYSMCAANLGQASVAVSLFARSGGVNGGGSIANVANGDPDGFVDYTATLAPPGGAWTVAILDASYLCATNGTASDDGTGNHRTRWRIVDGGDRLTAVVTFTLATPLADSGASTDITPTTATLNGHVDPKGANAGYPASYYFQYGLTAAYGSVTATQTLTGSVNTAVSAAISGLVPTTTYHWRLVAFNADGTSTGTDQTLVTTSTDQALFIF